MVEYGRQNELDRIMTFMTSQFDNIREDLRGIRTNGQQTADKVAAMDVKLATITPEKYVTKDSVSLLKLLSISFLTAFTGAAGVAAWVLFFHGVPK